MLSLRRQHIQRQSGRLSLHGLPYWQILADGHDYVHEFGRLYSMPRRHKIGNRLLDAREHNL